MALRKVAYVGREEKYSENPLNDRAYEQKLEMQTTPLKSYVQITLTQYNDTTSLIDTDRDYTLYIIPTGKIFILDNISTNMRIQNTGQMVGLLCRNSASYKLFSWGYQTAVDYQVNNLNVTNAQIILLEGDVLKIYYTNLLGLASVTDCVCLKGRLFDTKEFIINEGFDIYTLFN